MAWCPIGYVCIPEIYDACESAAIRLLQGVTDFQTLAGETPFNVRHPPTDGRERGIISARDEALFSIHGKILTGILDEHRHDALVCSPSGQLLKISGFLLDPPIFNHWFQINERYGRPPQLRFVDVFTGLIDLKNSEKRIKAWWGDDNYPVWICERGKRFSHLEGWSVCFAESKLDMNIESLIKRWAPSNTAKVSSVGRPSKQDAVASAYRAAFPNGHGDLSYKKVLEILKHQHGVYASPDTLQRVLGVRK